MHKVIKWSMLTGMWYWCKFYDGWVKIEDNAQIFSHDTAALKIQALEYSLWYRYVASRWTNYYMSSRY